MNWIIVLIALESCYADREHSGFLKESRRHVRKAAEARRNARRMCGAYQRLGKMNRRHSLRENCAQIQHDGCKESGRYFVQIDKLDPVQVYCDMDTDGGGWTLIHQHGVKHSEHWSCYRRNCSTSTSENWNRTWNEYRAGFGQPSDRMSDYWIGLDWMHQLTKDTKPRGDVTARINLIDWTGDHRHADYEKFQVRKGVNGYAITLRGFSEGDPKRPVGDAFSGIEENVFCTDNNCNAPKVNKRASKQNGQWFSTYDRDHDLYCRPVKFGLTPRGEQKPIFAKSEEEFCKSQTIINCAVKEESGFWFNSCSAVNLNGRIFRTKDESSTRLKYTDGMIWATWHKEYYSLMFSNILVRPANFHSKN